MFRRWIHRFALTPLFTCKEANFLRKANLSDEIFSTAIAIQKSKLFKLKPSSVGDNSNLILISSKN